ncbi:hypothetical protein [Reichenbachiella agariperforans]|uniref:hypothetical protein n=1 Tax=Reichenbachiella agariperforans TaxID=156994 RepID=UPI001C0839D4|nr:hypothetical protein [Reichenbachiella agariperforans]MBU2912473.1 hypothetical protein [Reichenbachiella agariperforans]
MLNYILRSADNKLNIGMNRKHNWFSTILVLTFWGGYLVPVIFKDGFLKHGGTLRKLFVMCMSYFTISVLYGLIFGLLTALIMRFALSLFEIKVKYLELLKLMRTSYEPFVLILITYTVQIAIANYYESTFIQENLAATGIMIIVFSFVSSGVVIWASIIFYRGMNRLTGLNFFQNFLIHIGSGMVLAPINIYIMYT